MVAMNGSWRLHDDLCKWVIEIMVGPFWTKGLVWIVLGQGRSKWIQNRSEIKELLRHITIFMCNPLEEIKLISYHLASGKGNMIGFYFYLI